MDFTSILKNELFRPVTTLIVPGSIAIAPYIIVANYYVPKVFQFWGEHPSAFVAIVVVVIIATGLVLDNWGAAIEFYVLDRILEEKYPGHQDRWYRYLKLKISDEYVGQRYLRNSLVRMKFELAMAPATLLFWLGIMWVHCKYPIWSAFGLVLFSAFSLILVAYFLFEAYQSAYNLGKERVAVRSRNGVAGRLTGRAPDAARFVARRPSRLALCDCTCQSLTSGDGPRG